MPLHQFTSIRPQFRMATVHTCESKRWYNDKGANALLLSLKEDRVFFVHLKSKKKFAYRRVIASAGSKFRSTQSEFVDSIDKDRSSRVTTFFEGRIGQASGAVEEFDLNRFTIIKMRDLGILPEEYSTKVTWWSGGETLSFQLQDERLSTPCYHAQEEFGIKDYYDLKTGKYTVFTRPVQALLTFETEGERAVAILNTDFKLSGQSSSQRYNERVSGESVLVEPGSRKGKSVPWEEVKEMNLLQDGRALQQLSTLQFHSVIDQEVDLPFCTLHSPRKILGPSDREMAHHMLEALRKEREGNKMCRRICVNWAQMMNDEWDLNMESAMILLENLLRDGTDRGAKFTKEHTIEGELSRAPRDPESWPWS